MHAVPKQSLAARQSMVKKPHSMVLAFLLLSTERGAFSGWNALAPWALPACRGPPEEVYSLVALHLPKPNHKASSPFYIKGLGSRPKVISVCSAHPQDLLYVVFDLVQQVLRTLCERSGLSTGV